MYIFLGTTYQPKMKTSFLLICVSLNLNVLGLYIEENHCSASVQRIMYPTFLAFPTRFLFHVTVFKNTVVSNSYEKWKGIMKFMLSDL